MGERKEDEYEDMEEETIGNEKRNDTEDKKDENPR